MTHEFSRTQLLIGEEALNKLQNSTILIFGIGGVGSHCTEALARCGIGHLILADHDKVSLTNINRQSIAYYSTIGEYKTLVMKKRILDINHNAFVETFEQFLLPENLETFFQEISGPIDYIIDAIDTVAAKIAIIEYAKKHKIPILSSMGTGNKLHGELFQIADLSETSVCPLCRVMRRELKKRDIHHVKVLYSKEEPLQPKSEKENEKTSRRSTPGSISFVPPVAGLLIAGEVLRELSGF